MAMAGGSPGGGLPSSSAGGGKDKRHMDICEADAWTDHAHLSELPDPLSCYAALIMQYNLCDATVVAPNIRDGAGKVIRPDEYNTKLVTGNVVMVECLLKL